MKQLIFITLLSISTLSVFSQYRGMRQNGALMTSEEYVTNSPGNSASTSKLTARLKDSTYYSFYYPTIRFALYNGVRNDGTPTSILWTDIDGNIQKSPIPSWITNETDPIFNVEKTNYYTKTMSDSRYLQSFTELDPTVPTYAKTLSAFYVIKASTDVLYKPIGYIPSWIDITGKPTFSAVATSGDYNDLINKPTITSYTAGTGISISGGIITNTAPVLGKVFNNNVSRSLNSNYTISSTRDCIATYSISLSCTNPLLAGSSSANAFLEYSTDGGTNWITVSNVVNSSSVALAVTIALTQPNTFILSGIIPANGLVRLRTTTSGTASVSYSRGQEVYI